MYSGQIPFLARWPAKEWKSAFLAWACGFLALLQLHSHYFHTFRDMEQAVKHASCRPDMQRKKKKMDKHIWPVIGTYLRIPTKLRIPASKPTKAPECPM